MSTARQNIITKLMANLATISTGNGYATAIGSKVKEWQMSGVASGDVPGIFVKDTNDSIEQLFAKHEHRLSIEIQVVTSGFTTRADLRSMVGDVYRCIKLDPLLSGYVYSIEPGGDVFEIEQHDTLIGITTITIFARFITDEWDSAIAMK